VFPIEETIMAQGHRDPVREQQWRERVAAWQSSGLTIRAFCVLHGLAETTFQHWRRELRERDAQAASAPLSSSPRSSASRTSSPRFVPLTVLSAPTRVVEVRCPSGHVVTVSDADHATLQMLFAALNQPIPPGGEASSC